MYLHHLRNATFIIESNHNFILVDPMLGKKGSGKPFTIIRFKPQRNPIVDLPANSTVRLDQVTHCLITHLHPDHLDKDAEKLLEQREIPVICSIKDYHALIQRGLNVTRSIQYWKEESFLGGKIIGIPAVHGYGFISKLMGNVMGYFIELPNEKSIYISSDTIYTKHVDKVLRDLKPEISVLACGTAQLDLGQPLLMRMDELIRFIQNAPGKIFANHLEALNHCPTTRHKLKKELVKYNLFDKVFMPNDGENMKY
jgi:L-ascorbate metabolism protein UlaG (beta-lactamase superfamily)